jgi:aminoglycoside phosphotransferase (APT) family kinase protein
MNVRSAQLHAARTRIEPRIDRALAKRRERLASPRAPYSPAPLDEIRSRLERFLAARLPFAARVLDVQPLTGGASKQHFAVEIEEPASGGEPRRRSLVLRTALAESLGTAPDLQREFEIQRAIRGVVPVPEVLCADPDGVVFDAPAIVLERMPGATVPPEAAGKPSGFGSYFSPERRALLAPAFVENLVRIHGFADAPAASTLESFERPRAGTTEAADSGLAWWKRVWSDDALEDHPMVDVAFDWLEEHAPVADRISFLHGDYRTGNFLFDPDTNRVTAILDWEMSRFGDRHEDLGWTLARIYTAKDDDGTELVCGLATRDWFLRRYAELSGLPIDPERLFFYEVFNELKIAVIALGTGPRNAHERQSHAHLSNLIFAPAGFRCLARLHELLAPRLT